MTVRVNWSLRLAQLDDATAMPAIETAASKMFDDGSDSSETDHSDHGWNAEELRNLIRKGHCLVVHVGDAMAGFLASEPFGRELHIWEMDVHPRWHRNGMGSGLVRAAMIDARNSGFSAITLTTYRDLAWNAPFYAQLGFEEVIALDAHPRLAGELAEEADDGLAADRRCAMIRFLN